MRIQSLILATLLSHPLFAADAPAAKELFNGKDLSGWKETDFGGQGITEVKDGKIIANMGASLTGVQYTNSVPTNNYAVTMEAMKIDGGDFFVALTFPVGTNHCSLIMGGWG